MLTRPQDGAVSKARPAIANTVSAIEVIPSGAALAAEVRGIDLSLPVPEEVKVALRKAWADHMVLVIRGQNLDDDQLEQASLIFGPPHEPASRKYHVDAGHAVDDSFMVSKRKTITIISNLDASGNPVMDNGGLGSYEVIWHTDNSYVKVPPAGSMLYSLEIPKDGGGGDTSFNNQYRAYEELPENLKRALYLGRRRVWPSNYIIGLPNEESEKLLDALWAHATQPKYAWTHKWKVGDLVLWDNRCCMHYRTEVDTARPAPRP